MATADLPFSDAYRAGDLLFCSGQTGWLSDEERLAEGFDDQVRQSLANLSDVLVQYGCTLKNLVKVNIFLVDISDFSRTNDLYAELMGDHRPARACVAVVALPRGARFEIEGVAHIDV